MKWDRVAEKQGKIEERKKDSGQNITVKVIAYIY